MPPIASGPSQKLRAGPYTPSLSSRWRPGPACAASTAVSAASPLLVAMQLSVPSSVAMARCNSKVVDVPERPSDSVSRYVPGKINTWSPGPATAAAAEIVEYCPPTPTV